MLKGKTALALAALLVTLTGVGSGRALECNGQISQVDTPAGTFYVDDRGVDTEGVWLYQESNGEAGLQSGGISAVLGDLDSDTCTDPEGPTPDTLLV